ncbi:hypothetical protein NVP1191O_42 [Vibrio phage 1.191.O._10N.286.52.B4]|nr:hypothetical protein NVP1191O_42 [Vibrio phage 1.191.O._10N.286.52.B4]
MKHKNCEMLSGFSKHHNMVAISNDGLQWRALDIERDMFACIEKHQGAVIDWLDGTLLQVEDSKHEGLYRDIPPFNNSTEWDFSAWYMREDKNVRIKPKKEKRWIAYSTNQKRLGCLTFDTEVEARNNYIHEVDEPQFIEIEVEI